MTTKDKKNIFLKIKKYISKNKKYIKKYKKGDALTLHVHANATMHTPMQPRMTTKFTTKVDLYIPALGDAASYWSFLVKLNNPYLPFDVPDDSSSRNMTFTNAGRPYASAATTNTWVAIDAGNQAPNQISCPGLQFFYPQATGMYNSLIVHAVKIKLRPYAQNPIDTAHVAIIPYNNAFSSAGVPNDYKLDNMIPQNK